MTIIIPAYKPDEKLIRLIRDVRELSDASILVVNDGSGEAFDEIFRQVTELGCTLLIHPENRGKGAALKTAFRHAVDSNPPEEVYCTADADGQHLPKDILRCLEEAGQFPGTLVLGARGFRGNVPFRSRFGNSVTRGMFHLLMGKRIFDTQTGLRAFSGDLLPDLIAVEGDRYEYEMQMLCRFAKRKRPIREVEIETVYIEENRSSHFHPLRDAGRIYKILLKNACSPLYQGISFLLSSGLAFLVDLIVYGIFFNYVLGAVVSDLSRLAFCSLLIARAVSSAVNFWVNRKVVFRSKAKKGRSFLLYLAIVVFIFLLNHFINVFFLEVLRADEILSLILTQIICFPISFLVQKYGIFRKNNGEKKQKNK